MYLTFQDAIYDKRELFTPAKFFYLKLRRICACLLFVASFFVFANNASAATWYVSPTGTDDPSHGVSSGNDAWATLDYALTGNRVSKGDTINIEGGTYSSFYGANTSIRPSINTATGTGPVVVQAYPEGANVTLNIPSNTTTGTAFIYLDSTKWTELTFKHINFTNSNSVDTTFMWLYGHLVTVQDSSVNMNDVGKYGITFGNDTEGVTLNIIRSNISHGKRAFVFNQRTDGVKPDVNISSSVVHHMQNFFIAPVNGSAGKPMDLVLTNNTFVQHAYPIISYSESGGTNIIKNNIFYVVSPDNVYEPLWFVAGNTAHRDYIDNPENFVFENNVWYMPDNNDNILTSNTTGLLPIDSSNHYIDPQFTATSTDDYTIQAGSKICGLGSPADLPIGGDINTETWTGADIGAYKCPTSTNPVVLLDKVAFIGDSILRSSVAVGYFNQQTNKSYVAYGNAAISGANMQKISNHMDTVMVNDSPDTVFLSIGINNLASQNPVGTTNQEYANYILEMLEKIESWGARPYWLGIGSLNNFSGFSDTNISLINDLVEEGCVAHGWKCKPYLNQLMLNPNWQSASPDGYYDTPGDVHPNTAGRNIIGAIAEYLYYSDGRSFVIGTHNVDSTGNIRIYKDGMFRYTSATSSATMADFSVTPVGGFGTGDYSEWLNVSDITWNTSGTYSKQWTASSTVATTTVYSIGDLSPSTRYTVRVDGATSTDVVGDSCTDSVCDSDEDGQIVFTYSGGYSTHDFNIDPTNIPTVTTNSPSSITTKTFVANGSIDAIGYNSPTTRGFLYGTDSTLVTDISTTTETGVFSTGVFTASVSGLTCGNTYYIRSYATNSGGTGYGSIVSFNTKACSSSSSGSSSGRNSPVQDVITTTNNVASTGPIVSRVFSRNLELESIGDDVKELQKFLNSKGFIIAESGPGSPGNETNLFGSLTKQALIKFQISHNINPAIGYFGPLTRAFVNEDQTTKTDPVSTTNSIFTRDLEYGYEGEDVKQLQIFLNTHGYTVTTFGPGSRGNETTIFGQSTQSALIKFQVANKITPAVGFFGPVTRKVVEGWR